jgi:hypothetical protein
MLYRGGIKRPLASSMYKASSSLSSGFGKVVAGDHFFSNFP